MKTKAKGVNANNNISCRISKAHANIITAKKFKRQAVKIYSYEKNKVFCNLEAEFEISGNLYCPDHFDTAKADLKKIGKIVCVEMAKEGEA